MRDHEPYHFRCQVLYTAAADAENSDAASWDLSSDNSSSELNGDGSKLRKVPPNYSTEEHMLPSTSAPASLADADGQPSSSASASAGHSKLKGSLRLRKWASIRRKVRSDEDSRAPREPARFDSMIEREEAFGDGQEGTEETEGAAKEIYIISDGTGWTADNAVHAALGQFDYCFADGRCPVKTRIYSQIRSVEKLLEILRMAGENRALVVSTLVESSTNEVARTACRVMRIPHVDMMDPLLARVEELLGVSAERLPRGSPGRKKSPLSKEYFRRIEAVDFTIKQDDGAQPRNLDRADLVLVGVSRTGKTPLSIYLAQKGYKVANVPLVLGVPPPPELFSIDQSKIFALTIDPYALEAIRRTRFASLGILRFEAEEEATRNYQEEPLSKETIQNVDSLERRVLAKGFGKVSADRDTSVRFRRSPDDGSTGAYHSLTSIKAELEAMHKLFREHPTWPVIDVTGRAVEETAVQILSIRYERIHQNKMPYITRRY